MCHEFLRTFEGDVTLQESWESLRYYYELFRASGDRNFEVLKLPRGIVDMSRVGRQSAAVLIHDEIQLFSKHPVTSVGPTFGELRLHVDTPQIMFQSFEDFITRDGTSIYYFRHSDTKPEIKITADYLWPNRTDNLLLTIAFVLSGSFSNYVEPFGNIPDRFDLIDSGVGIIEQPALKQQIEATLHNQDDFTGTIKYAKHMSDTGMRLSYYIRKAASLCYQSHITANHGMALDCIKLCDEALRIDSESVVLLVLKNILHDALGEKREAQLALSRAFEIAGGIEGIEIVKGILEHLYVSRWEPEFPSLLWEYYQSF